MVFVWQNYLNPSVGILDLRVALYHEISQNSGQSRIADAHQGNTRACVSDATAEQDAALSVISGRAFSDISKWCSRTKRLA
jgi:hypothetical protein